METDFLEVQTSLQSHCSSRMDPFNSLPTNAPPAGGILAQTWTSRNLCHPSVNGPQMRKHGQQRAAEGTGGSRVF